MEMKLPAYREALLAEEWSFLILPLDPAYFDFSWQSALVKCTRGRRTIRLTYQRAIRTSIPNYRITEA
jgi:hypothetical protein